MERIKMTEEQIEFIERRIEWIAIKQILPTLRDIAVNAYLQGMADASASIGNLECDVIFWKEKAEKLEEARGVGIKGMTNV